MYTHPFSPLAEQMRALQEKLSFQTYLHLFGQTPQARSAAAACAQELNNQLQECIKTACTIGEQLMRFNRSPNSGSTLLTAQALIRLIEQGPYAGAMDSGPVPEQGL